jgi:starch phosphorylase
VRERLRVVFVPDFNVKNAAAHLPGGRSVEQISTAGKEASGTGNMKLSLNGALTIGTLDGANVEIRECGRRRHFFLFGLTAEEVAERKRTGYRPYLHLAEDQELSRAIDLITSGMFSPGDRGLYAPLVDNLVHHDPFLVLADFRSYVDTQRDVGNAWQSQGAWTKSSILNTARAGKFSSDRSISEYAKGIWRVQPVKLK